VNKEEGEYAEKGDEFGIDLQLHVNFGEGQPLS
jgi:hypothetical protein